MQTLFALLIIAAAVYVVVRGVDVRLVLFAAGLALASLAREPWRVLDTFLEEMANVKTIGPICSAMGYAYVLRATGSDRELVRLLIAPLQRVRWLLIPGGCAVGFLTNIAITSQTAAAAAVGPILVPLMVAAGYHPIIAAATLVLGCSGGGSLYNPGDADLVAIQESSQAPAALVIEAMFLPLLSGFVAAVAAFVIFSQRRPKEAVDFQPLAGADLAQPVNYLKAALPPLPIALISLLLPSIGPLHGVFSLYRDGLPVSHAMLISTACALLIHRKAVSAQAKAFFEGMGYAYMHIISLIVTASCFIAGMTAVGLTERLITLVSGSGPLGKIASLAFPGALGVLTGSGIGPSVAFSKAVLPTVSATDLSAALDLGVLAAIGASFGRTMSPVAAVVVFTAGLVHVSPLQIIRRTAPPLAVGAAVVLLVVLIA